MSDTLLAGALATVVAIGTSAHVLLSKRDPRAAFGWIAVCLLFPFAGPILYLLFGVNRISTRARKLESGRVPRLGIDEVRDRTESAARVPLSDLDDGFRHVARVSEAVTRRPLLAGNRIEPLFNGEQAYPAMIEAIEEARECVLLQSYIFQTDTTGRAFVDALGRARRRSVEVRIIVDGVGEYYAWPHVSSLLKGEGLPHARFLPPRLLPPAIYVNLRNHRKVLVVDHRVGFTGGMNIGDRYLVERLRGYRVSDLHFRLEGPVVAQLEHVFLEDWAFCTGDASLPGTRIELQVEKPEDGIRRGAGDASLSGTRIELQVEKPEDGIRRGAGDVSLSGTRIELQVEKPEDGICRGAGDASLSGTRIELQVEKPEDGIRRGAGDASLPETGIELQVEKPEDGIRHAAGGASLPETGIGLHAQKPEEGICRSIVDGPNEALDRLATTILGAIDAARTRILVVTPYFLPPENMQSALCTAALRGVRVDVLLPSRTYPPMIAWAARHGMDTLLAHGVRVHEQPPPFDHTKLLLVDDYYVLMGSTNLDPRSLKLNFELCVEVYDRRLNERLRQAMDRRVARACPVAPGTLRDRSLPVRLRDAACWLFSPYL